MKTFVRRARPDGLGGHDFGRHDFGPAQMTPRRLADPLPWRRKAGRASNDTIDTGTQRTTADIRPGTRGGR